MLATRTRTSAISIYIRVLALGPKGPSWDTQCDHLSLRGSLAHAPPPGPQSRSSRRTPDHVPRPRDGRNHRPLCQERCYLRWTSKGLHLEIQALVPTRPGDNCQASGWFPDSVSPSITWDLDPPTEERCCEHLIG